MTSLKSLLILQLTSRRPFAVRSTFEWSVSSFPLLGSRFAVCLHRKSHRFLAFNVGPVNDSWVLRGVVFPNDQEPPCWMPLDISGVPFSPRKAHAIAGEVQDCHASEWQH